MIESVSNGQYKRIQKLMKQSRARRQEQCFAVEGWKMVQEALDRKLVQQLYVEESEWKQAKQQFGAEVSSIPFEVIKDSLFRQLSDTVSPQGILGLVRMPVYDRERLLATSGAKLLCLEDIQDPGNLGTMMRTAEGAGMTAVILSRGCVDLFNPKVVRATMGALFRVPFYICEDLVQEMRLLQEQNFRFYAAHLEGSTFYTDVSYEGKIGLLIGNEANGLSEAASRQADVKVKIPMRGELESLNAAVSAAILMYETARKTQ